jgi:hypothetical protein
MMTRLYQAALAGMAFSIVCAGVTGADQVIDRGYDHAIALASQSAAFEASANQASIRLVRGVGPGLTEPNARTAATEHAWLTAVPALSRPELSLSERGGSVLNAPVAEPTAIIATAIGARFTVVHAGQMQTLEVVEVREIAGEFVGGYLTRTAVLPAGRLLMVSCKIVTEAAAPSGRAQLVRFLVDADDATVTGTPRAL